MNTHNETVFPGETVPIMSLWDDLGYYTRAPAKKSHYYFTLSTGAAHLQVYSLVSFRVVLFARDSQRIADASIELQPLEGLTALNLPGARVNDGRFAAENDADYAIPGKFARREDRLVILAPIDPQRKIYTEVSFFLYPGIKVGLLQFLKYQMITSRF